MSHRCVVPGSKGLCQGCIADAECGLGSGDGLEDYCVFFLPMGGFFCTQGCDSSHPCPEGYVCVETKGGTSQCVPEKGCG
ncbi:MAG: hypothetical protein GXP49_13215 [Deltaproteobacteria bacterium]|nr:hypothetical protein [Deltaproteobacteria bacterium]